MTTLGRAAVRDELNELINGTPFSKRGARVMTILGSRPLGCVAAQSSAP